MWKQNKLQTVTALTLSVLCLMTGCTTQIEGETETQLQVVSTTTMLQDLVSVIGGGAVNSLGLMGAGIDPHLYQASAGDVAKLEQADVVVYNGLHLEGQMGEVFQALEQKEKTILCAEEAIDPELLLETEDSVGSTYDPHIWYDLSLWMEVAEYIAEGLVKIDPDNSQLYQVNLSAYLTELSDLETYIETERDKIPEGQRVLITAHDAFGYFGRAYGFEVLGLQGISTESEASTSDVSQLAELIAQREIPAIFIESSLSPKSIQALQAAVQARGFQVEIGGQLYSDSLGDQSTGHDSYLTTVKANIDTIVEGLS